ncbi:MAG: ABC transporter permease [Saprospiraceae bacterium]|nr:ABC transporter permease [Saprospiraceae bacterium]
MARYAIRRIILILPTIFLVMLIAFILSKLVPGDAASAMLLLQGVNPERSNAKNEYQRQYGQLGLNKPTFYFSVIPDFYPENINEISDQSKRYQTIALLKQKLNYQNIASYLDKRDIFISQMFIDKSYRETDTLEMANKLAFETDISRLDEIFDGVNIPDDAQLKSKLADLTSAFQVLKAGRTNMFYPRFIWHGINNQFHQWGVNMICGNFGVSMKDGRLIAEKIYSAIKWTILLVFLNILISCLIAIPTGMYAGYRENSHFDIISNYFWLLLYSVPVFWLASMMIIYFTSERFGTWMDIFPAPGNWFFADHLSFFQTVANYSGQLILPVLCLAANDIAQLSRVVRNNVINQKSALYVKFALSKGLNSTQTLFRHILPNVMIPLITIIGARIPAGLSGALVIEVIFNIPGMGRLMFDSIFSADWNVVFGILIIISFFTITFMLITDLLYAIANPRINSTFR